VPGTVRRYLDALPAQDWATVRDCLADDVVRFGPYHDVYRGKDDYVRFLTVTFEALRGYELVVERIVDAGRTVLVELVETVDDGPARLRTAEAIVFDLDGNDRLARIAVYLQSSSRT
jgi:ketosteroid isomerase-like protein